MDNTKIYTAQEMREESNQITRYDCYVASDMLRQAAEMYERCEATIRVLDNGCHQYEIEILNYILRGDTGKEEK